MSSPQLNTAVATIVFKGKGKSLYNHKSYRQVRVTPLIGRLLDEYLRPVKINLTREQQNINQYGFSENISYMMGALQRHEVEKYCMDNKITFYGCSLDGESAFEVVNRTIQLRELYCSGEKGEYLLSSKYSYENSLTQIKMKGKLSRKFQETTGVKQGLQGLIGIAENYGERYKITYGASKTKITVVGSEIDMEYFSDTTPWTMGEKRRRILMNALRKEEAICTTY